MINNSVVCWSESIRLVAWNKANQEGVVHLFLKCFRHLRGKRPINKRHTRAWPDKRYHLENIQRLASQNPITNLKVRLKTGTSIGFHCWLCSKHLQWNLTRSTIWLAKSDLKREVTYYRCHGLSLSRSNLQLPRYWPISRWHRSRNAHVISVKVQAWRRRSIWLVSRH